MLSQEFQALWKSVILSTGRWLYTFTFKGGKWGKTDFFSIWVVYRYLENYLTY
jgi:hypothetical protein